MATMNVKRDAWNVPPINRVPTEVLAHIFKSLSPVPSRNFQGLVSSITPAFALSQVCQYWRATALSTPALWSGLYLLLPEGMPYEPNFLKRASMMIWKISRTVISRSANVPLTLDIDPLLDYTDVPDKLYRIGAPPDRWGNLKASPHTLLFILRDSLDNEMDLSGLQQLTIVGADPNPTGRNIASPHSSTARFSLPDSARVEATFRFGRPDLVNTTLRLPLPWSRVVRLTLDVSSVVDSWWMMSQLDDILGHLRNASHLELQCTRVSEPNRFPDIEHFGKHQLRGIQYLSVNASEPCLWSLLCLLELPSVKHLEISSSPAPYQLTLDVETTPLFSFFLGHCPQLRHLTAHMVDVERSFKIIQKCKPETVVLINSFSEDPQARSSAVHLLRYIAEERPNPRLQSVALSDASRLSLPFVMDALNTLEGAANMSGDSSLLGGAPTTSIVIHSACPLPSQTRLSLRTIQDSLGGSGIRLDHRQANGIKECRSIGSLWSTGV